ncbi:Mitochondrial inner membrane translocase subunit Tim17/Tim22/Tim23/peroxisomal protein PMP24 [Cynara cardunculus var. scolymus]|uniref:Mitochondrial inner membrane translocase subunit Tim17/Tim22/Tim23/peroxisomal protein PMP24 n=1 Tax=Cynara cardunculus var. scolymus TaxID=59895 RepID=A0A124SH50_CYNCS|nr:Mitochondrial inner membrane translocase subunit Tim17/Tim22/Tim23/peroxisomal protein PMP24 [Cynara cardunculus var. scolymus]
MSEDSSNSPAANEAEKTTIEPIRLPTIEEVRGQDIWNNCAVKSVASGVMGLSKLPKEAFFFNQTIKLFCVKKSICIKLASVNGAGGGLGLAMGLFLGALDNPIMQDEMTGRQQFIYTAKQMGRRSWGSCKAFAVMGFIFSAAECARAKHDMTNTVAAGCVTGGAISAKGGPKAACFGCAGFAAFSVVIEKFLDRHGE